MPSTSSFFVTALPSKTHTVILPCWLQVRQLSLHRYFKCSMTHWHCQLQALWQVPLQLPIISPF